MDVIDVAAINGPVAALVRIVKGTVLMVYKLNALGRQTRSLDSHHHLRNSLPLSDLIAYSFQEPREI
jgi:hypothetical protein